MARYGNRRRPSSIHCPACQGIAATRKGSACRFCGVKLYYVGEIVVDDGERAFVWLDDAWKPVVDGKGTTNGKGSEGQAGAD